MRFEVSFTLGAFDDAGEAFCLVVSCLKKDLTAIRSSRSFPEGRWIDHYSDMQKQLSLNRDISFSVHAGTRIEDLNSIGSVNAIAYWRDQAFATEVIAMEILEDSFIDLDCFINEAAIRKFNFAMFYNATKACWQREQFVFNFHKYGKSLDGRKLISHPYWTDKVGLTVDIRNNPGRHIQTHNMRLMAAPEMWFGPGAWGYFEESDVLDFDIALEKKYVAPGTIYIKLFDINEHDYEASHILDLQWEFRQCTKMDAIEDELNGLLPFPIAY